jgi:D-arabinose 1-dehydrogenase-like Zn-dependent alcohol dehydrogenase
MELMEEVSMSVKVGVMSAAQVAKPGGGFEFVEKDIPEPGPNEVRVKVEACGVCHSDSFVVDGTWPGLQYPRVPGHEIAGVVDAVGSAVKTWRKGQRAGIGWHGGQDGTCDACRRGRFVHCVNAQVTGISFDGGYADFVVAPQDALAALPEALSFPEAAPLLCAGVTTYNALRHTGAHGGDLVAVHGIGGLGHLAVQFANKMGFRTAAIARGKDKEDLARKLGAHLYIDSDVVDPAQTLRKFGGARVILATAPSAKAISALTAGLGVDGELMIVGIPNEPLSIGVLDLITKAGSVRGWAAGSSIDSQDTLNFCALTGIRPMIETFPRRKAAEAYERMISGKARFRSVIVP